MDDSTVTLDGALALVSRLRTGDLTDGDGAAVRVLRVHGSPRSGKSTLCERALEADDLADAVRRGQAVLISSHRTSADEISERLVRRLGTTREQRPAKTMPALAFRLLRDARRAAGVSEPKLVNGAQQEAVISAILRTHLHHVRVGDDCPTCDLFRHYLAVRQAAGVPADGTDITRDKGTIDITRDQGKGTTGVSAASASAVAASASAGDAGTVAAFEALMTPAFAAELRDMFARLAELSLTEEALRTAEADPAVTGRQGDEWDLAAALWKEYLGRLAGQDPQSGTGPYRVDSSEILVRACEEVRSGRVPAGRVPSFIVVDDCQDLTLAGYALLRCLVQAGTWLVLAGCDDESVQTFRGAYPEVLTGLETAPLAHGGLGAMAVTLVQGLDAPVTEANSADTYRLAVASRVSRSIGSVLAPSDIPVPKRPGKLAAAQAAPDRTLVGRLFRSHEEENEDLVWQIRRRVEDGTVRYGDCAVIAHDNATLRSAGRALEQRGVPVSYSSVTRALKEIPVIRGLLGLLRLTSLVRQEQEETEKDPSAAGGQGDGQTGQGEDNRIEDGRNGTDASADAGTIAALMLRVLATPLFGVDSADGDQRPVRLQRLTSAFDALSALSAVDPADGTDRFAAIRGQVQKLRDQGDDSARALVDEVFRADAERSDTERGDADADRRLSADELLVLLLVGDDGCRSAIASLLRRLTASRWQTRTGRRRAASQATQTSTSSDAAHDTDGTDTADPGEAADADQATDPDLAQLLRLVAIVRKCSQEKAHAGRLSSTIHARLWQVWDATGVARRWQEEAVSSTPRGRAVNDWLDAVIRLFAHAQQAPAGQGVGDFLADIEGLQIEADSLASVAPRPDAVVLATPAGAAVLHKKYVWILSVQDGSWPNLSPRDALFDGQTLSAVVVWEQLKKARALPAGMTGGEGPAADCGLSDGASDDVDEQALLAAQDRDQRLDLLYTESKSFLVALTRGDGQTVVSAVDNEQEGLSDFLLAFLPELFTKSGLAAPSDRKSDEKNGDPDAAGTDAPDAYEAPDISDISDISDGAGASDGARGSTYMADGVRYSKVGRDPDDADARLPWLGGLDADPEGMAAAARLALAGALSRQMAADGLAQGTAAQDGSGEGNRSGSPENTDPAGRTIRDASQALRLLAEAGVGAADPSSWAFVASAEKSEKEQEYQQSEDMPQRQSAEVKDGFDVTAARNAGLLKKDPVQDPSGPVPLSPSAVDAIWRCPLCWSLDNRFSGPQPTDASRSLGTLLHEVAQWATDTGLDRAPLSQIEMFAALRMRFNDLLAQAPRFTDPDQSFRMASGSAGSDVMLSRMASYFIDGRDPGYGEYPQKTKDSVPMEGAGSLEEARAEVPFTAVFGLHDIGGYVRRTPGLEKVSDHELFVVLGWLAGGFPQGTREDLRLRLSARIDRLERRGANSWDILDWKTGRNTQVRTFSDLQLVCYQLGLTFSQVAGRNPVIDRSMLFRLRLDEAPASSHGIAELGYQPPLFVDGHLDTVYAPRPYLKDITACVHERIGQMDHTAIDSESPVLLPRILGTLADGYARKKPVTITDEEREKASHDLLPWDLAMIARVFYAGACLQTGVYPSRHGDDFTRYKEICPQWPDESDTIYGHLHAGRPVLGRGGTLVPDTRADTPDTDTQEER